MFKVNGVLGRPPNGVFTVNPYQVDQMMNATLLDQLLGVAIRINNIGGWRDMIPSEAFEKAIGALIVKTP